MPYQLGMPQFLHIESASPSQLGGSSQGSSMRVPNSFQSEDEVVRNQVSDSPVSAPQLNDNGRRLSKLGKSTPPLSAPQLLPEATSNPCFQHNKVVDKDIRIVGRL